MRLPGWIDRDDREPTSRQAAVILSDGARVPVTITNASDQGCEVECADTLPIGAAVQLEVGGAQLAGKVRWCIDGKAGLQLGS